MICKINFRYRYKDRIQMNKDHLILVWCEKSCYARNFPISCTMELISNYEGCVCYNISFFVSYLLIQFSPDFYEIKISRISIEFWRLRLKKNLGKSGIRCEKSGFSGTKRLQYNVFRFCCQVSFCQVAMVYNLLPVSFEQKYVPSVKYRQNKFYLMKSWKKIRKKTGIWVETGRFNMIIIL